MNDIGRLIKERRMELDLTLKEVADAIGVSEATAQRYESGEIKNLKHATIEKLANVLQVSPSQIMGWEEKKSDKIADEFKGENFTDEEITELKKYAEYLKSKRK